MLPYTAYLRVYEPLEAFPEPERSWWAAYAGSARRPRRVTAVAAEHAESLRALLARPGDERWPLAYESQNAYVRLFHGKTYVCPWRRRLRSWAAFSAAQGRSGLPGAPAGSPHIRQSNWHVPFAWFVPFTREERWLELGDGRTVAAPPRTLTYVTTMARARERLGRAVVAAERAQTAEPVFDGSQILLEALSAFHPHALVELDYGGLVHLLDDASLAADDSAGECAVALLALERGEPELAIAMRLRLGARWQAVRALQRAN